MKALTMRDYFKVRLLGVGRRDAFAIQKPAIMKKSKKRGDLSDHDSDDGITVLQKAGLNSIAGCNKTRVWLVKNTSTDDYFALKEILLCQRTPKQLEHIDNECAALETFTELKIRGVVALRGIKRTPSSVSLLLDLCSGGPLHHHIRSADGLSIPRTKFYVAQLSRAIGELHSLGYVYRDIKASNVTLDERGCATLVDLGFVKNIKDRGCRTYTYCGTYHSMAPELHRLYESLRRSTSVEKNTRAEAEPQPTSPSDKKNGAEKENPTEQHGISAGGRCMSSEGLFGGKSRHAEEVKIRRREPFDGSNEDNAVNVYPPLSQKAQLPAVELTTESADPELGYGFAVDWWALGILTFEMLANAAPFGYTDFENGRTLTVRQLAERSPEDLSFDHIPDLCEDGRDFILQLLQRDVKLRLGSKEDFSEVRNHPWLRDISWDDLYSPLAAPPIAADILCKPGLRDPFGFLMNTYPKPKRSERSSLESWIISRPDLQESEDPFSDF